MNRDDPPTLVLWAGALPLNTTHLHNICTMLVQRRRRWADVVQMLYKCCVFAGPLQWLKLPAWKVGDRGFEPRSGIRFSKKQNVSSPLSRKD